MKIILGFLTASILSVSAFADICNHPATLTRLTGLLGGWGYTVVDFGSHTAYEYDGMQCTFPAVKIKDNFGYSNKKITFSISSYAGLKNFNIQSAE